MIPEKELQKDIQLLQGGMPFRGHSFFNYLQKLQDGGQTV